MIPFNRFASTITLALTLSVGAHAQSTNLEKDVESYFLQTLNTQLTTEVADRKAFTNAPTCVTHLQQSIKNKDIPHYQEMVWKAWQAANRALKEQKLIPAEPLQNANQASWDLPQGLESNAKMPYYYGTKGTSDKPRPLFLYLHGSGPKAQEWQNGILLAKSFNDSPSSYFIPQIPNEGEYYRWWQLAKQFAWEKLIRQSLAEGAVDANRLYVFGISEGGYGSQRLASFYADYWAAAGPMAGGEPLKNAPVENCANIGFSFLTGADDTGFYRNILTHYTQVAFDSAQLSRPLSADQQPIFRHRVQLLPGMQHHIDYRLTTPWMRQFVRNPYPKTVLWEDFEMDGRHRSGFYNLQVLKRPSALRTYYDMSIQGNVITLSIQDVRYTTTEKEPQWGIEMKFNRSYSAAQGGELRIYLNDKLVNLNKEVTVIINGKKAFQGVVKANLKDMINSCVEYYDPYRVFPTAVEVSY